MLVRIKQISLLCSFSAVMEQQMKIQIQISWVGQSTGENIKRLQTFKWFCNLELFVTNSSKRGSSACKGNVEFKNYTFIHHITMYRSFRLAIPSIIFVFVKNERIVCTLQSATICWKSPAKKFVSFIIPPSSTTPSPILVVKVQKKCPKCSKCSIAQVFYVLHHAGHCMHLQPLPL